MTTKFIGMKDFRQNMTKYSELARKKKIRYIVLKKNTPILEVSAISEKDYSYIRLKKTLEEAETQVERGEFYTADEIKEMFGLK
jgi:PHD/YefM family antitoxin component YafN of YafNO toxin-antitoxin module